MLNLFSIIKIELTVALKDLFFDIFVSFRYFNKYDKG